MLMEKIVAIALICSCLVEGTRVQRIRFISRYNTLLSCIRVLLSLLHEMEKESIGSNEESWIQHHFHLYLTFTLNHSKA